MSRKPRKHRRRITGRLPRPDRKLARQVARFKAWFG